MHHQDRAVGSGGIWAEKKAADRGFGYIQAFEMNHFRFNRMGRGDADNRRDDGTNETEDS
jgi:hypothetical protein